MLRLRSFYILLFIINLIVTSCINNSGVRKRRSSKVVEKVESNRGSDLKGPAAGPDGSTFGGSVLDSITTNGKAELLHLVDPLTGVFKKKITIPFVKSFLESKL